MLVYQYRYLKSDEFIFTLQCCQFLSNVTGVKWPHFQLSVWPSTVSWQSATVPSPHSTVLQLPSSPNHWRVFPLLLLCQYTATHWLFEELLASIPTFFFLCCPFKASFVPQSPSSQQLIIPRTTFQGDMWFSNWLPPFSCLSLKSVFEQWSSVWHGQQVNLNVKGPPSYMP